MKKFIQVHVLQEFPASNPNRDDTGRNKSMFFGDAERLRISSQCISRNLRTNSLFSKKLQDVMEPSQRTMRLSRLVKAACDTHGITGDAVETVCNKFLVAFEGKVKKGKTEEADLSALMFISGAEVENIGKIVEKASTMENVDALELTIDDICNTVDKSIDMGFWGRMFASNPQYNRSSAMQVAHAFTTGRSSVDHDFFTAVDDLNDSSESGSAHLGERSFGSGLYYLYFTIDMELLTSNFDGDAELAKEWAAVMVKACTAVSPTGHSSAFGPPTRAEYVRIELGDQAPSSLANAYSKSNVGRNDLEASAKALEAKAAEYDTMYDDCPRYDDVLTIRSGQGSMSQVDAFIKG